MTELRRMPVLPERIKKNKSELTLQSWGNVPLVSRGAHRALKGKILGDKNGKRIIKRDKRSSSVSSFPRTTCSSSVYGRTSWRDYVFAINKANDTCKRNSEFFNIDKQLTPKSTKVTERSPSVNEIQNACNATPTHHGLFGDVRANCKKNAKIYVDVYNRYHENPQWKRSGLDVWYVMAQTWQESGYNSSVGSPAGAVGCGQFMERTAQSKGVNRWNCASSVDGQVRYLLDGINNQHGNLIRGLAYYNAGPGKVSTALCCYSETRNYVKFIPLKRQMLISSAVSPTKKGNHVS